MIYEISGDILFSSAKAIVQGVAPNDDFHHGLAMQLRERMPAMYKDFRHYCQTRHPKPGSLWDWTSPDGRHIVSLFTQDGVYNHGSHPGRASLSHVNHALHALRAFVQKENVESVSLPRLACGITGLIWSDVKPLIEHHLSDLAIPVYIYSTYQKGVKASEPAQRK
jgi:O-acetyl-ADP-ribose deacetylase (regulator of RNase III)